MTQKERKAVQRVCKLIDAIYCLHNKNLTQEQVKDLGECLEKLESIGVRML